MSNTKQNVTENYTEVKPFVQKKITYKCKLHKTNTHTDDECLVQKKKKYPLKRENKEEMKVIKESDNCLNSIYFGCMLNNSRNIYKALIDSGSTKSYISNRIVEKENLNVCNYESFRVILANGNEEIVMSSTVINLINKGSQKEYKVKLYILKTLTEDIILGNDFLNSFNCIINYNTRKLKTSLESIDLEQNENDNIFKNNVPDRELLEASKLLNIGLTILDEIDVILNDYKSKLKDEPIEGYEYSIKLSTKPPVTSKPYPIPLKYHNKFKEELKRLTDKGIIKRSTSPYSTPVFVTEKVNGDLRILADFRKLNKITITYDEVFPSIQEEFFKFKGKKIFSTLDMRSGYYQVKIKEKDCYKTAIITEYGKFQHQRIAFGLKNAPKFFHSMMRDILSEFNDVHVYVDDIIVATESEEQHLVILKKIFNLFILKNININIEKCQFFQKEVKFLGNVIDEHGIRVDQSRLKDFTL